MDLEAGLHIIVFLNFDVVKTLKDGLILVGDDIGKLWVIKKLPAVKDQDLYTQTQRHAYTVTCTRVRAHAHRHSI